jgi:adenylate kinase
MIDIDFPAEHITVIKNWLKTGSINIFGLPFAGKDTHGETLSALLDAPLLGGGEILRGSVIPPAIKAELDAGHLIPTADYLRIVTPYLSREAFKGKPLILSSVGRWSGEEEGVLAATEASGHPTKAVIYLHAGEEVVFRRWKKSQEKGDRAGRADDVEHVLETRIQEFNEKTLPVIEVYRQKKLLIEVNSDAEKTEVLENILARLYLLACSKST